MSSKLLITSGCSFSECITPGVETWPNHLANKLTDYQHVSKAMGSQGNGLISRGVVYEVTEALKTYNSENIIVGIMWSGPSRHDFYMPDAQIDKKCGWIENPTGFINNNNKNWVILNHQWNLSYSVLHYGTFYNIVGSIITTLEHILRVQWLLKLHKIKYFMTTYTATVFQEYQRHPDIKHLIDQIDFEQFLPVNGMNEWRLQLTEPNLVDTQSSHPTNAQHLAFVEQIVMPWLQNKKYIK